mmetsp:Transcript_3842/g.7641  ORF Transcript_3842/g.7641 Transcript_3842/m.7641 type:complete len:527 (-) Transcript_3842:74-1654(-)|eukprot:scaffold6064_cov173-Amphora_coffeaeformis.AAC.4
MAEKQDPDESAKPPLLPRLEPVYLLYDERMLLHRPIGWKAPSELQDFPETLDECPDDYPMENPERLRVIYQRLMHVQDHLQSTFRKGGDKNDTGEDEAYAPTIFRPLRCRLATKGEVLMAHSEEQFDRLDRLQHLTNTELLSMSQEKKHDIYYCRETFQAARLAAGGLLACVDAVCDATSGAGTIQPHKPAPPYNCNKAVALVRPPGHHACQALEMGFCFLDSVVLAAKYAIRHGKASKVAILDWDIHDSNGTAEATIKDENILRIDLHRFNPKEGFYPYTGPPTQVGTGRAKGLNCNITWSQGGMGNAEYAAAFYELVLPLLANFQPDLLLISCGLDAAKGDLLGGCNVTSDFYHAMTRATLEVVGIYTPVVCALEGGYTMSVLPDCMEAVTLGMLNCPYKFHSALTLGSYLGGAAQDTSDWPTNNPLERARRALSKYYKYDGSARLEASAIFDINTSIRIFQNIPRWSDLDLQLLDEPARAPPASHKRKWETAAAQMTSSVTSGFQRPRVYLWYGTEMHHKPMW